jgi:hypothetical protein
MSGGGGFLPVTVKPSLLERLTQLVRSIHLPTSR